MTQHKRDEGRQMRFTDDELKLLKSAFEGNEKLLKLMRKVFLPEIDPEAPLGQLVDLWMVKNWETLSPEEVKIIMMARKDLIMHIESQLLQLKVLSEMSNETEEEKNARLKKDSLR